MQTHTVRGNRGNMTWKVTRGGRGLPKWLGYVLIGAGLLFVLALARYQMRLALFGTATTGEVMVFDRRHNRAVPRVRFTTPDGRVAEFHGTSLRGMMTLHQCPPEEFISFVHDKTKKETHESKTNLFLKSKSPPPLPTYGCADTHQRRNAAGR